MSKKIQKAKSDQVSRLVSRLAEFKLTQEQTPPQENTSTRSVSTQTFVPTAAQLAEVERVLVFCAWVDDEPIPSPEEIYQATIEFQLYHNWWDETGKPLLTQHTKHQ